MSTQPGFRLRAGDRDRIRRWRNTATRRARPAGLPGRAAGAACRALPGVRIGGAGVHAAARRPSLGLQRPSRRDDRWTSTSITSTPAFFSDVGGFQSCAAAALEPGEHARHRRQRVAGAVAMARARILLGQQFRGQHRGRHRRQRAMGGAAGSGCGGGATTLAASNECAVAGGRSCRTRTGRQRSVAPLAAAAAKAHGCPDLSGG